MIWPTGSSWAPNDTVYHEHFSYLSLHAVQRILQAQALRLWDVEQLPTHGGSLRVYAIHADDPRPTTAAVAELLVASPPMAPPAALRDEPPDEVLILPWNIAEEVKAQLADLAECGPRFVTAVPELKSLCSRETRRGRKIRPVPAAQAQVDKETGRP